MPTVVSKLFARQGTGLTGVPTQHNVSYFCWYLWMRCWAYINP